jgi:hypothetical protein
MDSMIDLPDTAAELFAAIPDEDSARNYLIAIRWPDGVRCAHCASDRVRPLTTRPEWWSCRDCRGQTSLRSQSVLHASRRPLLDWIYVIWAVAHPKGPSVLESVRVLGVKRYATLFVMFHKVRAALQERAGWEIAGEGVSVGFGWFAPGKLASGDPRELPQVLVALTGKGEPGVPGAKEIRFSSLWDEFVPQFAIDEVLQDHVARGTSAQIEVRPPMWGAVNTVVDAVRRPFVRFLVWIRLRFRGVSRRYLGNYLASFVYGENRWGDVTRLFDRVAGRAMREIFRPAARAALEPLLRRAQQRHAA